MAARYPHRRPPRGSKPVQLGRSQAGVLQDQRARSFPPDPRGEALPVVDALRSTAWTQTVLSDIAPAEGDAAASAYRVDGGRRAQPFCRDRPCCGRAVLHMVAQATIARRPCIDQARTAERPIGTEG